MGFELTSITIGNPCPYGPSAEILMVRICGLCFKAIILQIWPNLLSVWPDDQIVFSIFGHLQQWKSIQIVPKWVENVTKTK